MLWRAHNAQQIRPAIGGPLTCCRYNSSPPLRPEQIGPCNQLDSEIWIKFQLGSKFYTQTQEYFLWSHNNRNKLKWVHHWSTTWLWSNLGDLITMRQNTRSESPENCWGLHWLRAQGLVPQTMHPLPFGLLLFLTAQNPNENKDKRWVGVCVCLGWFLCVSHTRIQ